MVIDSLQLVELAALVARHGPALVESGAPLSEIGLRIYWSASRCRLDRWNRQLDEPVIAVMEEVLTGEVLTRVWTAIVAAHDCGRNRDQAEPVVRHIFVAHAQVRRRVLERMLEFPAVSDSLNLLRRRCENWTDQLIGPLAERYDVSEFAFARRQNRSEDSKPLLGSLKDSPNRDLNARIAAGILACFPGERFESAGILRSLWMLRLEDAAQDAQGLVADLLGSGVPLPPPGGAG